jgi:hypothetical protein
VAIVDKISKDDDICLGGRYFLVRDVLDVVLENWKPYFLEEDLISKIGGREDFCIIVDCRQDYNRDALIVQFKIFAPRRVMFLRSGVEYVQNEVRIQKSVTVDNYELYRLLTKEP